jgi:hypothetical protein
MAYFTIYHAGAVVGGEFGISAEHALDRYAAGSIYLREELTAKRGAKKGIDNGKL